MEAVGAAGAIVGLAGSALTGLRSLGEFINVLQEGKVDLESTQRRLVEHEFRLSGMQAHSIDQKTSNLTDCQSSEMNTMHCPVGLSQLKKSFCSTTASKTHTMSCSDSRDFWRNPQRHGLVERLFRKWKAPSEYISMGRISKSTDR